MRTWKYTLAAALTAACCLLPLAGLAESYGVIRGGRLNLRAEPHAGSDRLGQYPPGTWLELISKTGSWYFVEVEDGATGYMSGNYIVTDDTPSGTYGTVDNPDGYVNLRKTPSLSADVLARYNSGTRVDILSQNTGWYQVRVDGLTGFMVSDLVRLGDVSPVAYATVSTPNGNSVNLRGGPSKDAPWLSSWQPGTAVEILVKGKNWHKVRIGGTIGFMSAQYLTNSSNYDSTQNVTVYYGVVNNPKSTQVLNLRQQPSLDAKVLGYYGNGTLVKVLSKGTTWHEVLVGSQRGYMMAKYIRLTGNSGVEAIRRTATLVNPNGGSIVNFRSAPSLYAKVLGVYSVGTQVTVVESGVDWTRVNIGGSTGYVSSYFLQY